MNGLNGVLIIGIGLFLLYLGFTGKLDCIISVFKTCASSDTSGQVTEEATGGASIQPGASGQQSVGGALRAILDEQ